MSSPVYNYYWDVNDPARPFTFPVTCNAISLVPDNATRTAPPVFKKGTIPCWNGTEWVIKLDWRQEKLYEKSTGKETGFPTVDVDETILDRDYTNIAPTTEYDKWDEEQGKWVTDTEAQKADKITALLARRKELVKIATRQIDLISDVVLYKEDAAEEDLPAYEDLYKQWRLYRGKLLSMKFVTGEETFPEQPTKLGDFLAG